MNFFEGKGSWFNGFFTASFIAGMVVFCRGLWLHNTDVIFGAIAIGVASIIIWCASS